MAMGIVDTLMVGPLGPEAIGGVGLAGILFFALAACGMGVLLGLDTVVSQAYGAGDHDACRRWLWQGLWLGLFAAVPLAGLLWLQRTCSPRFGFNPAIVAVVRGNLDILWLTLLPLFVYAASRRYLQAIGLVRPVMFALVAANVVNAIGNWALIYGHLGLPALGTDGAAWATLRRPHLRWRSCRSCAIVWHDLRHHTGTPVWLVRRRPAAADLAVLLRLGVPAMLQMVFEVGGFALASSMAASQTRRRSPRTRFRWSSPASPSWCRSASPRRRRSASDTPSDGATGRARTRRLGGHPDGHRRRWHDGAGLPACCRGSSSACSRAIPTSFAPARGCSGSAPCSRSSTASR